MKHNFLNVLGVIFALILSCSNAYSQTHNREIRVVMTDLSFREIPSFNADIISIIPKGTTVDIEEDCNCEWILIKYQGQEGYILNKYLEKTKVADTLSDDDNDVIDLYPISKTQKNNDTKPSKEDTVSSTNSAPSSGGTIKKPHQNPSTTNTPRRSNQPARNTNTSRVSEVVNEKTAPAGATAICRDGTYSYSKNRRGTCSRHGGVARWL